MADITEAQDGSIAVEVMKKYIQILEKLNPLLTKYNDADSIKQLEDSKERLNDILDALGLDAKGRDKTRKCLAIVLYLNK